MEIKKFIINAESSGMRLDRFLRQHTGIKQCLIEKLIRKKKVLLDNKKAISSDHILENQVITLKAKLTDNLNNNKNNGQKYEIKDIEQVMKNIEYEDSSILILNKPENICMQPGTKTKKSLDSMLRQYNSEYRITHRLDKETSGLIIIAKNRISAKTITEMFKERRIKKEYIAIVSGTIEKKSGIIKKKIHYGDCEKDAETRYQIIGNYGENSIVRLIPITGRKHQLRIHLSSIGHPILGDKKHGNNETGKFRKLYLHAASIEIEGVCKCETQLPDRFLKMLNNNQQL